MASKEIVVGNRSVCFHISNEELIQLGDKNDRPVSPEQAQEGIRRAFKELSSDFDALHDKLMSHALDRARFTKIDKG